MVEVTPKLNLNIKIYKASLNKWMSLDEFKALQEQTHGDRIHDRGQKSDS